MKKIALSFFVLATMFSCSEAKKEIENPQEMKPKVVMKLEEGEEKIYAMPGIDHGLVQSPVNILSTACEYSRI